MRFAFLLIILFATEAVFAHHGRGQFSGAGSVEVTGKVTKVRLVNPHGYIYFDVTDEKGKVVPWRCELQAGSLHKRAGWTTDLFPIGSEITIRGEQGRSEPTACSFQSATLADGSILGRHDQRRELDAPDGSKDRIVDGVLDLNGTWAAKQRHAYGGPAGGRPANAPPRKVPGQISLTEAGWAAVQAADHEQTIPRYYCTATNIFFDWEFDRHVNEIIQTKDSVKLKYGYMDIERTIHLNMDEHPKDLIPSRAGHSIGRWEENTLVVDTVGFSAGFLAHGRGSFALHSDALRTEERFSYDADTQSLVRDYTAVDPLYIDGTYGGYDVMFSSDVPFETYDCVELKDDFIQVD